MPAKKAKKTKKPAMKKTAKKPAKKAPARKAAKKAAKKSVKKIAKKVAKKVKKAAKPKKTARKVAATKTMPAKAPKKPAISPTAKAVTFSLDAPSGWDVSIAGTFNNWEPKAMFKDTDGIWRIKLYLEPGTYEYRFLVDTEWRDDPMNPNRKTNEFGSYNSITTVS